jgi:hypothetical protein
MRPADEVLLHQLPSGRTAPQRHAHPRPLWAVSLEVSGDHLVDRIDGRQMRDEEGQRDADEDDEDELREALQDVDAIGAH